MRQPDRVIAEVASVQFGRVARWQLLAFGISLGAIRHRIETGRLHIVRRGIYAVGHTSPSREARWWEGVLTGEDGACLGHMAAGAYWRLRDAAPWMIDVIVPRRKRSQSEIRFHCEVLPEDEIDRTGAIPVTTAVRTCFDLAGYLEAHQLERAINELEVRQLWSGVSLPDLLERHPRRKGAVKLRRILDAERIGLSRSRNDFEAAFLPFLDARGIPRPVTNTIIETPTGSHEGDCVWHDEWLNVELDGRGAHATSMAFERDRRRDRALAVAGWQTYRVTWRQFEEDPDGLADDIRALLRRRAVGAV